MIAGLANVDLGSIIKAGGNIIDDLFTSDEEKMALALKEKELDMSNAQGQIEINKAEATHRSWFVAGWRPALGWIGGAALAYKFIFHPFLMWFWCIFQAKGWIPVDVGQPPSINATELYPIIMGMLGLGTMRTVEGIKNVKADTIGKKK
jgi:hypothetical protein